jgi:hypothetical protein
MNWTSSVAPVRCWNAAESSEKNGCTSGFVPSMIQTVSVRSPPLPEPVSPPQPVRANAAAAATAIALRRAVRDPGIDHMGSLPTRPEV